MNYVYYSDNFRENFIKLRKNAGLSIEQLAKKTGISVQCFKQYERGVSVPNTRILLTIADFFRVPLDALFSRKVDLIDYYRNQTSKRFV